MKSNHGAWSIVCDQPAGASGEQCALMQNVLAEDRPELGLSVVVLKTDSGVELNLIVNAPAFDGKNRLMDVPDKFPGFTHVALRVASIDEAVRWAQGAGIAITDGPKRLGDGISMFFRDPDANVIELRQDER